LPRKGLSVIDPNDSVLLKTWDALVALLLIATAWLVPFEAAFLQATTSCSFALNCAMDAVFTLDLGLQFFVAYSDPVHPERLVKEPRRVVRRYLSSAFALDLASVLPVDLCCAWAALQGRRLGAVRLVRLLRLARLKRLLERWHTSFGFSYANLSLAKFLVLVLFCCHWMACLWGAIGVHAQAEQSWLTALRAAKEGPEELYEGSFQVYSISLYWAIISVTSIGYGDITPQTVPEYWVATLCTSIMASIWAYVIGAVCGIVSTMHPHEVAFQRTMDDLNWLMGDRSMPTEMCKTLRRYFHETRDMNRQRTEQEIIAQMSPKLQGEYAHFMHKRWIAKVWYLRGINDEIIVWAARHLAMAVYAPKEEVLNERTLFIVQRGLCALKGKILVSGDIWGEDMLLSNEFLRDHQRARSLGYLSVLMLHILDLVDVVANFPEARARLRWAQVQIALMRGVQRIAEKTQELSVTHGLRSEDLTEHQRMDLFADILKGKFAHKGIPEDYLGVDLSRSKQGATRRSTRRLSQGLSSKASADFALSSGDQAHVEGLTAVVGELERSIAELGAKVERLCVAQGPLALQHSMGSGHAAPSARGRGASSVADFGPVIPPFSASSSVLSHGSRGSSLKQAVTLPSPVPSYLRCMRKGLKREGQLPTLLP